MIYKLIEKIEFISNDFKEIFQDKNNLIINKILNIYEYYQILCFDKVKEQLKQNYQEQITDKELNNSIENFIKNNLVKEKTKNIIETALRKFIICFLVQIKEKEKEKKIKQNKNNIKNYLEIDDLWTKNFYKSKEFYQELKNLQLLGIQINNIIPFYDKCFKKMHKNYFDDVKNELKEREEEKRKEEEEKAKDDIRNFNTSDTGVGENKNEPEEIKDEENVDNNINDDDDYYTDEGGEEEENTRERIL